MSLSDVMSGAGFAAYAEVALVISVVTFLGIAVWAFRRPRDDMDARARTVLEDDGSEGGETGLDDGSQGGPRT